MMKMIMMMIMIMMMMMIVRIQIMIIMTDKLMDIGDGELYKIYLNYCI